MDILSYNCNGHNQCNIKMDRHQELPFEITNIESLDYGIGSQLEYWTAPRMVDINKNAQIDLCGSIIYGDAIDHVILPKDNSIQGDVRRWRDLTSHTNSSTKLSFIGLACNGRLEQTRSIEEKETYHEKKFKVEGNGCGDEDGTIAHRQEWEEGTRLQGEDHHPQYNVLKEEIQINSCQMDQINELDIDLERNKGIQDCGLYRECQKNQSTNCGMTSIDNCKNGMLASICATCRCHRNFHQRIIPFEEEQQQEVIKIRGEKKGGGGNNFRSICDIDQVARELIATANSAITLAQDSLCYSERRSQELSIEEQNIIEKISLENLGHITKVINSTSECLLLLQKPDCPHEGPSSSDASPVITVEKQATQSLLTPTSPARPFAVAGPPVKNSITVFSDACGTHNCGSAPRKLIERASQKLKRTRTRISLEQREKLNAFAEKAGWTVVGQRKETIDAACQYIGIEPKTLKYWIHNSKQKWKRQPGQPDDMSKS